MVKIDENYFKVDDGMKENSIEDILDKDEQVLLREKPYKKAYILAAVFKALPFTLIWLAFDTAFIVGIAMVGAPKFIWGFIVPFFALHLTPVWFYFANIIRSVAELKNMEYVFTEKRIIIRSGVIGIDFKNILYTDIKGVNLKVGLIDRLCKVGDIYITALEQSAVLYDIQNPYRILKKMQRIVNDIKTDIIFPNALRPSENPGFKTKYKPDDED